MRLQLTRRVWTLASVVLIGICLAIVYRIDWDAFGPAIPPDAVECSSQTDLRIVRFTVNDNDLIQDHACLPAASIAAFRLVVEADTSKWNWNVAGRDKSAIELREKQQSLPRSVFKIEFVRRSAYPPGEIVVRTSLSNPRRNGTNRMEWERDIRAPVPIGVYQLRLAVGRHYLSRKNADSRERKETEFDVIGVYEVQVE